MKSLYFKLGNECWRAMVRAIVRSFLVAIMGCPLLGAAQTLTITNGIQTYSGLTNTTVTMTGQSELMITGTNNPLAGCTINLNSTDAWLVLPNIRPSAFLGSYLRQITVNGVAAASGGNVRVAEYVMGTVVLPHSPSITPLQIFSGPNFVGNSMQLGLYTYFTNTALGALNRSIDSFKLKRGYMATFAQNADGTGASKVFIAQDGDISVGLLEASLNRPISFVRVFPWQWVAKRGWADTAGVGGDGAIIKPYWFYDWGSGASSTSDAEYAPMKWSSSSGISSIKSKQNSSQALGYNEPDSSSQANMTTGAAIADWPSMMQWGLRVGAPAVSDSGVTGQGLDWLYGFMNQATNLGYRVDYVPIHWYKCGQTAAQLSNYLAAVHQQTGRPVWLTEFNYGANWCDVNGSLPPTPAQEASEVSQFISVLENSPFVERYSIYNWVTTNREMVLDNGVTITPAGILYRDTPTTISYKQTLPAGGGRGIAEFHFETNVLDSSGYGNNGFAVGIPGYTGGQTGQAVTLDGTNSFITLPPTVAKGSNFTFAAWVYWNGGASFQRIFDFGNDTTHYLFLTPGSSSGTLRFAIRSGGSEQDVETAGLPVGQWCHVAVTLNNGSVLLYTNGTPVMAGSVTVSPANFSPANNYLGKSQFPADPLFNGSLDEVQIADYAFTQAQIAAMPADQPPQFTTNYINGGVAAPSQSYTTNVTGFATDPDSGDILTYSKASGPAWLIVNADGSVTGTPGSNDGGTNYFTICTTDTAGKSAFTVLSVLVPIVYASGSWTADADGNWSQTNDWSTGLIANGAGFTADFSALNITATRNVMLDGPHSLGTLKFGDISGSQSWILSSDGDVLTLDTGSTVVPSIVVNQNTATITAPLLGANGFAKTGAGTLVLSGANNIAGIVYIDRNSTTVNDGAVSVAGPTAFLNVTNVQIRNNNTGSSTLQLDGSNGNITSPLSIALSGRNASVPAVENLAGSNTLSGGVSLNVGGGLYIFQSDAGVLNLGGNLTAIAAGNRTFTFQGNGDFYISGVIQNGVATNGVTKTGAGTLTLAGLNTYTNTTTVTGGILAVNGLTGTGPVVVGSPAILAGSGVIRGPVTIGSGGTMAPGTVAAIGTLTVANTVALQPGSLTHMRVSKSPAANDLLKATGLSLTYGGTLVVTNLAGILTVGDSFKLFSASAFLGSFSGISPATPGTGLLWNTNNLTVNGTLSVMLGNPTPQFGTTAMTGDGLVVNGSGGAAGAGFSVLSSTNLVNWNVTATGTFDSNGNFVITNVLSPDAANQFFQVRIP